MMPVDRGVVFEDPLDAFLRQHQLGEVTGGGTLMSPEPDGIASCDVEMRLDRDDADITNQIIDFLENLGAAKGSVFRLATAGQGRTFGKMEGLGLSLNGTDLAAQVYAGSDVNAVLARCIKDLAGTGIYRGCWQGSRETALYFYGPSFQSMQAALADCLINVPLCEQARIVQIA